MYLQPLSPAHTLPVQSRLSISKQASVYARTYLPSEYALAFTKLQLPYSTNKSSDHHSTQSRSNKTFFKLRSEEFLVGPELEPKHSFLPIVRRFGLGAAEAAPSDDRNKTTRQLTITPSKLLDHRLPETSTSDCRRGTGLATVVSE